MTQINERPDTIFKYENFTTHSLLNLQSQSIYFGSPEHFNDPYDSAITAAVADPTPDELMRLIERYQTSHEVAGDIKTQLASWPLPELKSEIVNGAMKALNDARDNFMRTIGVSCFSERNDDLLMWSRYGGCYKGFCLEFKTGYEPFNKLRKVRYVREMPVIRIDAAIRDSQLIDLFCTKSEALSYEQEWRGFYRESGAMITYKAEALKAAYFGPDIDEHAVEIVRLILAAQNPEVELWLGSRSETAFQVNFSPFA